ncbi:hypothetical protein BKA83DRAFT_1193265 [Pisolithus microcarpus]|nr:hypothetical protein BKA83DRAFT_1193265 [Pisolithus microcarpus]
MNMARRPTLQFPALFVGCTLLAELVHASEGVAKLPDSVGPFLRRRYRSDANSPLMKKPRMHTRRVISRTFATKNADLIVSLGSEMRIIYMLQRTLGHMDPNISCP